MRIDVKFDSLAVGGDCHYQHYSDNNDVVGVADHQPNGSVVAVKVEKFASIKFAALLVTKNESVNVNLWIKGRSNDRYELILTTI